jgi:ferredoxin
MYRQMTKLDIADKASQFGIGLVGFTSAGGSGSEWARTTVILAAQLMLPIVETCPSIWGLEHEKTVKILLSKAVNRVCAMLNANGYKAERAVMNADELADAASRAKLGSRGKNGRILTKKYGPRVLMDSLLSAAEFSYDDREDEELCLGCSNCLNACPAAAGKYEDSTCAAYGETLAKDFKNPCGKCLRVCPVGEDRFLYDSFNFQKYFDEDNFPVRNPGAKIYGPWAHVRNYGSYPHAAISPEFEREKEGRLI